MEVIGVNDPLILCIDPMHDEWLIRWHVDEPEDGYVSAESKIVKGKPTLDQIKEIVKSWIDEQTDQRILSGHTYEGHMVWLSRENQINYKAAFDLAMQFEGQHGTLPVMFKLGTAEQPVYRRFETLQDLQGFYLGVVWHIQMQLSLGWASKDHTNWSKYEQD